MSLPNEQWDILIKGALVFDGQGGLPKTLDVAVSNGQIAALGFELGGSEQTEILDGTGKWLMPGLLDIHTHLDLEVEVDPGLTECVRHGTTSVVMSNCSLGMAYGSLANPDNPDENPIVDCFARVENMPKPVLESCLKGVVDWDNSADYLAHLETLPLGPNVAPMIPHSMLRIKVMGLENSISREPTESELETMAVLVEKGMQEGYVGFSTDGLPLHYLANDPHRNEKIPAQHAKFKELRTLGKVLRAYDRVWQVTPDPEDMLKTLGLFGLTCGRFFGGKPLRMTATAAMDISCNRRAEGGLLKFSQLLNSRLLNGDFTFQALSVPFKVFADGVSTPLMEEKEAFRELMAIELDDIEGRQKKLDDPGFRERFREQWLAGKSGYSLERFRHKYRMESTTFSRELSDMVMDNCPIESWIGQPLSQIYHRLQQYQGAAGDAAALNGDELKAFELFPSPIGDDANFMLHMLREYDRKFRWYVITANERPEILKKLVFHPETLPGFNDSGAHLTNMAYFDANLMTLKMAAEDSIELVAQAVKRLTKDPAELFGIDAGLIECGAIADLVLIDPDALKAHDSDANMVNIEREIFQNPQLVNRSDGVVDKVVIAGKLAWDGKQYTEQFGQQAFGRVLRHKDWVEPSVVSENVA
jgi:N-acyl-D-aspartate/D-glutamate deacylase